MERDLLWQITFHLPHEMLPFFASVCRECRDLIGARLKRKDSEKIQYEDKVDLAAIYCWATKEKYDQLLYWLWNRGKKPYAATLATAYCGRLDLLQWYADHGARIDQYEAAFAAAGNQIKIISWIEKNNHPLDICYVNSRL